VDNGSVTLDTDRDALKRLWDCYYVPMVKGYFGAYGSYRSDDVKTGDILAYTGSSTSSMYFPDEVETDGEREAIECAVMMPPVFEGGEDVIVQQGAGMVVSKSDRQHEYASVEFLKWFTEAENNLVFCSGSGYLPVLKSANSREVLDQTIQDKGLALSDKSYDSLAMLFDEMDHVTLYTNMRFRNGTSARQVLEDHLFEKAQADRENVKKQLSEGMTLEEACAPYLTDDVFEQWYQDFCAALSNAIK
jgi:multiple sugar transport system substrate-binding protein